MVAASKCQLALAESRAAVMLAALGSAVRLNKDLRFVISQSKFRYYS